MRSMRILKMKKNVIHIAKNSVENQIFCLDKICIFTIYRDRVKIIPQRNTIRGPNLLKLAIS